jgi:hypothetical protein
MRQLRHQDRVIGKTAQQGFRDLDLFGAGSCYKINTAMPAFISNPHSRKLIRTGGNFLE